MTLKLDLDGDTGMIGTRRFAAPPQRVYDAHLQPDLIRQWMLGPDGWTMPVCESDPVPGGKIDFRWRGPDGAEFRASGHYIALDPPHRIEHVERFHMPDPTPDNHCVTTLEPDGTGTLLTIRMSLPDKEARDALLATGMTEGMEQSYARLDSI